MAHIYPENIGLCKSNAERKLYTIFKKFSDDFYIIHSLNWLSSFASKELKRFSPDGEIDFVIIHKKYGVLCIEVKGGRISYKQHAFFTNGKRLKKSPYAQAKDNTYTILRETKSLKEIIIGYAVGFPDDIIKDYNNNYDKITFDCSNELTLEDRIIQIYKFWNDTLYKKTIYLSDAKIQEILDELLPSSIDVINGKIDYDNRTWLTLSKQQTDIITDALNNKRYFISGRAGTGKTILAVILARVLVEKENKRILFLSFNKEITEKIRGDLSHIKKNVDVLTFHHFLKIKNPLSDIKYVTKNERVVLNAILEKVENSYDCLIIDEAQSLVRIWLDNIYAYFKDKQIYVFADELQSFRHEGKMKDSQMNKVFKFTGQKVLTRNYRSPYKVYKRLLEIFTPSIEQNSPRSLDELDLVERISDYNIRQTIEDTIDNLLNQSVKSEDIIILVSSLSNENFKKITYRNVEAFTVQSYRGMEKPIVIYVISSAQKSDLHELYVAYSRATTQTIVIIPESSLSKGQSYLEKLLLSSDITNDSLKEKINHEIEVFNDLLSSDHDKLKFFNIEIHYSESYLLFTNQYFSFINKLFIEYFLKKNVSSIAVNSHDLNTAKFYSNIFKEVMLSNLEYIYCEKCNKVTYKTNSVYSDNFCINCSKEHLKPIELDELKSICNILTNPFEDSNKNKIPKLDDSLKTIGRFYYQSYHEKLSDEVMELLNNQSLVKDISGIIELIIAIEKHGKDVISIDNIRKSRNIKTLNIEEDKWSQEVGININRFLDRKLIEKIPTKGKYKTYKIHTEKIFKK